jgi:hypothetical protein
LSRHARHIHGDRVEAVKVVQQPGVDAVRLQGGANGGDI